jgi:hypothetical protein
MFINDVNKGFHVYDYTDPKKPIRLHFIKAPGATDLAIKGNTVYINQAVDLVTATFDPATKNLWLLTETKCVSAKTSSNGSVANTNQDEIIIDWTLTK